MSLAPYREGSSDVHIPAPSARAAMALQGLYDLTVRQWEPSIFSGLLSQFISVGAPPTGTAPTPAADPDMSPWTHMTPGVDLAPSLGPLAGFTPRGSVSNPFIHTHSQYDFGFEPDSRRGSASRVDADEQARRIDEMIAAMEEDKEAVETAFVQDAENSTPFTSAKAKSVSDEFQIPTPDTECSTSPAARLMGADSRKGSFQHTPDSMASPYVTASSSATVSTVSKIVPAAPVRQPKPKQLRMPNAPFIPPPPMCMFFSPAFRDLQEGKVGVWKGDLTVRGRGGGKFSVLVVGEASSAQLW